MHISLAYTYPLYPLAPPQPFSLYHLPFRVKHLRPLVTHSRISHPKGASTYAWRACRTHFYSLLLLFLRLMKFPDIVTFYFSELFQSLQMICMK